MNTAVMGALAGLGLAVLLFIFDYSMIRKGAAERAKRQHKTLVVLDSTEKKRLNALFRFCAILPLAGALVAWIFA